MHVTRDGAGLPHIHERRNIASVLLGVQTVLVALLKMYAHQLASGLHQPSDRGCLDSVASRAALKT
jgi:hypothetical protein